MQYIIVATKYLTKWVEAKVIKYANAKQTTIILYDNIISQFGCPKILIGDQGSHFLNDAIIDLTKLFNINHLKDHSIPPPKQWFNRKGESNFGAHLTQDRDGLKIRLGSQIDYRLVSI